MTNINDAWLLHPNIKVGLGLDTAAGKICAYHGVYQVNFLGRLLRNVRPTSGQLPTDDGSCDGSALDVFVAALTQIRLGISLVSGRGVVATHDVLEDPTSEAPRIFSNRYETCWLWGITFEVFDRIL